MNALFLHYVSFIIVFHRTLDRIFLQNLWITQKKDWSCITTQWQGIFLKDLSNKFCTLLVIAKANGWIFENIKECALSPYGKQIFSVKSVETVESPPPSKDHACVTFCPLHLVYVKWALRRMQSPLIGCPSLLPWRTLWQTVHKGSFLSTFPVQSKRTACQYALVTRFMSPKAPSSCSIPRVTLQKCCCLFPRPSRHLSATSAWKFEEMWL